MILYSSLSLYPYAYMSIPKFLCLHPYYAMPYIDIVRDPFYSILLYALSNVYDPKTNKPGNERELKNKKECAYK
jgi:hypothetical protein